MRYEALRREKARETLHRLRAHERISPDAVYEKGTGHSLPSQMWQSIADALKQLGPQKHPTPIGTRSAEGGRFEAEACVVVHERIPRDELEMLADPEFWLFGSIVHLHEIVDWRYGGQAALHNFGLGSGAKENLVYRLWLRGELGFDPSNKKDPYRLARLGDVDFWRSHLFRQSYGYSRTLVQALLRYQFEGGKPALTTEEIRRLAKRLSRLQANLIFELLNEREAEKLVQDEAERAKSDVRAGRG